MSFGGIRIDSSVGVEAWDADPEGNTKKIAETFREAAKIAADHGERLAAEGVGPKEIVDAVIELVEAGAGASGMMLLIRIAWLFPANGAWSVAIS